MQEKVNINDIETFSNKHGPQRTSRLLSSLGKDRQFVDAWESPAGKEILGHLLAMIDMRLDKIIEDKADSNEKAEYRICMELLKNFRDRVNAHNKNLTTLKRG